MDHANDVNVLTLLDKRHGNNKVYLPMFRMINVRGLGKGGGGGGSDNPAPSIFIVEILYISYTINVVFDTLT